MILTKRQKKCLNCKFLEKSKNGLFSCKKIWFGGVSEIPIYQLKWCDKNEDFEPKFKQLEIQYK